MNIAIDISLVLLQKESKIKEKDMKFLNELMKKQTCNNYYIVCFRSDINVRELFQCNQNFNILCYNMGKDNFLLKDNKYSSIVKKIIHNIIDENSIDILYLSSGFSEYFIEDGMDKDIRSKIFISENNGKEFKYIYMKHERDFIFSTDYNRYAVLKGKIRKKIAFFTPLPPIESGISDYSIDSINELVKYYDIDIFIDDDYIPNKELFNNSLPIKIFNHKEYEDKRKEYFETLYHVGGNTYHIYMFYYIKKYSGVVVLHDANLHLLIRYMVKNEILSLEEYKQLLINECDSVTKIKNCMIEAIEGVGSLRAHDVTLNGIVTNYAKKIVVHSNYAKGKLLVNDIGRNIKKIDLYSKIEKVNDIYQAKEELNISKDYKIISVFGRIEETKRIMPIVEAVNKLLMEKTNIKLFFVGKPSETINNQLNNYIVKYNLSENVIITGYVELDKFEKYIEATEICLNLRYPYNGESSASLSRIFSKGKCVVINDIGSFSEVPDDVCVKIPNVYNMELNKESDYIYSVLKNLINSPDDIEMIGKSARRYAEEFLDLKVIGLMYRNFIEESIKINVTEDLIRRVSEKYTLKDDRKQIYELSKTLAFSAEYINEEIIYKKILKNISKKSISNSPEEITINKRFILDFNRFKNKKVVIWGAGVVIQKLLKYYEIEFEYLIDNSPNKIGQKFLGKTIFSSDKLLEDGEDILIIVAIQRYEEVFKQLEKMGFQKEKDYYSIYEVVEMISGTLL